MLCRHFAKPLGFVLGASFFVCIRHKVSFTDASPPSKCLQLASLHAVFFLSRFLSAKLLFSRFLWWCSQCRLITAPLLGASVYPYYTLAILLHLPAYVYYRTILSSALFFPFSAIKVDFQNRIFIKSLHMSEKCSIFAPFFINCEYNVYALHIRRSWPTNYSYCHTGRIFAHLASAVIQ